MKVEQKALASKTSSKTHIGLKQKPSQKSINPANDLFTNAGPPRKVVPVDPSTVKAANSRKIVIGMTYMAKSKKPTSISPSRRAAAILSYKQSANPTQV